MATPSTANYGQPVTLTAIVPTGATGKVTFYDGVAVLGTASISGTQASLTTAALPTGTRSLRAHYNGDATYAGSASAAQPEVVAAGASLGLRRAVVTPRSDESMSMASGDFNRDGRLDIVVVDSSDSKVTVYLGNGDGTFQAGVSYPTAGYAVSVSVADFNGDGYLDLAVPCYQQNSVSILLGNGDGTFQPKSDYPTGASALRAVVADFNLDGNPDLAIAGNSISNGVYIVIVLLGKGDGSFGSPITSPAGAATSYLTVADFDGDGNPDLAVTASGWSGTILLGKGDGTFQAAKTIYSGYPILYTASADLNGDGKADLVVTTQNAGIYVLLGKGDGTFNQAGNYPTGNTYGHIAIEDFDGDGKLDIAMVYAYSYYMGSGAVEIFPGLGDGTFGQAKQFSNPGWDQCVTGDFNGDGKVDILTSSSAYGNLGIAFLGGGAVPDLTIAASHGTGLTQGQQGASYTATVSNVGDYATSAAVGAVFSFPSGITATSMAGNGWTCYLATLACTRSDTLNFGSSYPPITARVNVSASLSGAVTASFTVSGGGESNLSNNYVTDTATARSPTATTLTASPNPVTLGQSVTLTAIVTSGATGTVTFYDGSVALGSTALSAGQAVLTTRILSSGVRSLRASYPGDSNYGPSISPIRSQTVYPIAANGIQPATVYTVDNQPYVTLMGDFNRDGKLDILTTNGGQNGASVSVLLGKGDGTFQPAITSPMKPSTGSCEIGSAVVGDFNNDGYLDVVSSGSSTVCFLPGKGDGTFGQAVTLGTTQAYNLVTSDFNGDGNADLVGVNNSVVVYRLSP